MPVNPGRKGVSGPIRRRRDMRKLLLLATILLVGAAIVRQLLPAERRAELRERLSHMPHECDCGCHSAEREETEPPVEAEEKEAEPVASV
jgi:hypothetical protein